MKKKFLKVSSTSHFLPGKEINKDLSIADNWGGPATIELGSHEGIELLERGAAAGTA